MRARSRVCVRSQCASRKANADLLLPHRSKKLDFEGKSTRYYMYILHLSPPPGLFVFRDVHSGFGLFVSGHMVARPTGTGSSATWGLAQDSENRKKEVFLFSEFKVGARRQAETPPKRKRKPSRNGIGRQSTNTAKIKSAAHFHGGTRSRMAISIARSLLQLFVASIRTHNFFRLAGKVTKISINEVDLQR